MPWMRKGERRKNIPKSVVDIWAEAGWVLEEQPVVKPIATPPPVTAPEKQK